MQMSAARGKLAATRQHGARYATRDMPRARFYGRFEDDHFVAMKLIAADLRGLAGSAEDAYLSA